MFKVINHTLSAYAKLVQISWIEKFLQKGTEITAPVPMAPPGTIGLGSFEVPLSKGSTLRSDVTALNHFFLSFDL
ncbi:Pantothenate kinase 2 [Sesbania bispinosa]|nr:Pantothenate kinase 2 [Sesbania bispinosa]